MVTKAQIRIASKTYRQRAKKSTPVRSYKISPTVSRSTLTKFRQKQQARISNLKAQEARIRQARFKLTLQVRKKAQTTSTAKSTNGKRHSTMYGGRELFYRY